MPILLPLTRLCASCRPQPMWWCFPKCSLPALLSMPMMPMGLPSGTRATPCAGFTVCRQRTMWLLQAASLHGLPLTSTTALSSSSPTAVKRSTTSVTSSEWVAKPKCIHKARQLPRLSATVAGTSSLLCATTSASRLGAEALMMSLSTCLSWWLTGLKPATAHGTPCSPPEPLRMNVMCVV